MSVTVIDHFATPEEVGPVNQYWPPAEWPGWVRYDPATQCKHASDARTPIPPPAALLLHRMACLPLPPWCPPGLVPDLGLWGAGLHEMPAGPGLARHVDAARHGRLGLSRVLSAVLYVPPADWAKDWGGELELPGLTVAPVAGRLVIFDCRDIPHSVNPVCCPDGITRRSLALFWYSGLADPSAPPRATFAA